MLLLAHALRCPQLRGLFRGLFLMAAANGAG
jgi:hypothetical protein